MYDVIVPSLAEVIRGRLDSMPFDVLNSNSAAVEESTNEQVCSTPLVTSRRYIISLLEKGLLRPPLLLALYMLDLDHFEICESTPDLREELEGNNWTGFAQFNQTTGGSVAIAALHLWVIDLMESVSCWL